MKAIRIGTRQSPLALWQANKVALALEAKDQKTEILPISSEGDINLTQPIYSLGLTGVFTRSLDIALLNDKIDIAVHSLKDVPTVLPNGLDLIAYPERTGSQDILVYKSDDIFDKKNRTIATGSLRRQAYWNQRFPQDKIEDLRGNIQLRIHKLVNNENWDGAIFALAGLERTSVLKTLNEQGLKQMTLDWMIPAPSQGILGVVARKDFLMPNINDFDIELCATVERQFLNVLEGGCTAPIAALVTNKNNDCYSFKGAILSIDGKEMVKIERDFYRNEYFNKGREFAEECIRNGADRIIMKIKEDLVKKL